MTDTLAIPGKHAYPPVPCDTPLLIAWLNTHYGFAIPPGTTFHWRTNSDRPGGVGIIQAKYGKAIPAKDEDKGLFPSDAWAFVRDEEARIAGGQKSFFGEEEV